MGNTTMDPISASIGAGGSVLSSVLGLFGQRATNKMNWKINQSNQKFAADQADLSYYRQRQLIENQNEYNSPQNQKKLMLDAGYNPYNAVGQTAGTAVSSSSTNAPQASQPSSIPMQFDPSILNGISQAALNFAQIRNIDANTQKTKNESGLASSQALLIDSQRFAQDLQNSIDKDFKRLQTIIHLDKEDAERGLVEANTAVQRVVEKINKYQLDNILPKQVSVLTAQAFVSNCQGIFHLYNAAKTEVERQNAINMFAFQKALVIAQTYGTYAKAASDYSNARSTNLLANLWEKDGFLYKSGLLDFQQKQYDYDLLHDNDVNIENYALSFQNELIAAASGSGVNAKLLKDLNDHTTNDTNNFLRYLIQLYKSGGNVSDMYRPVFPIPYK